MRLYVFLTLLCFIPMIWAQTKTNATNPQCMTLPSTSYCASALPYTQVLLPNHTCLDTQEGKIQGFPIMWTLLSEGCRSSMASLMCQQIYPSCHPQPMCPTTCLSTVDKCNTQDKLYYSTLTGLPITSDTCALPVNTTCEPLPATFTPNPVYPRCEPYNGTICSSIIDYPVFIPEGFTQAMMEAQILPLYYLLPTAQVANGCVKTALQYMCATGFPRCDTTVLKVPLPLPAPFPRFPCRSVCTDFMEKCSDSMIQWIPESMRPHCSSQGTFAPKAVTSCNTTLFPAVDDYPVSQYTVGMLTIPPSLNIPLITQCQSFTDAQTQALTVTVNCPAPMVNEIITDPRRQPTFLGASCALPCNGHEEFTDQEWTSLGRFCVALSIVSFLLGLFLFLTWLCIPSKRKQRNTLFFNFCVMMLSLFTLIGFIVVKEPKNVGCKTAAQTYLQEDGGHCALQGWGIYYFAFAGIWWWTFIALDLFISIVVLPKRTDRQATIINRTYHSIAWGFPGICSIILLSRRSFGGQFIHAFCWFGYTSPQWEIWTFFVVPFAILTFTGFGFIIAIMVVMTRSASNSRLRNKWRNYIRPMLFMIQFGVLFMTVFGWYLTNLKIDYDNIANSLKEYVTCLLTGGTQQTCGTSGHPSFRPKIGWWYAGHFCLVGQGVVNFITYGTQTSNFVEWKKFIVALVTGRGMSYQTSGHSTGSSHKTPKTPRDKSNAPSGANTAREIMDEINSPVSPVTRPWGHGPTSSNDYSMERTTSIAMSSTSPPITKSPLTVPIPMEHFQLVPGQYTSETSTMTAPTTPSTHPIPTPVSPTLPPFVPKHLSKARTSSASPPPPPLPVHPIPPLPSVPVDRLSAGSASSVSSRQSRASNFV